MAKNVSEPPLLGGPGRRAAVEELATWQRVRPLAARGSLQGLPLRSAAEPEALSERVAEGDPQREKEPPALRREFPLDAPSDLVPHHPEHLQAFLVATGSP
jgi:hypothetical protein